MKTLLHTVQTLKGDRALRVTSFKKMESILYIKRKLLITSLLASTLLFFNVQVQAQIFSQDFSAATTVTYTAATALSLTKTSGNNIVGSSDSSQFTSIYCVAKTSSGIGINDATYPGKFYAGAGTTSFYWSLVKTTNFATTAPTALKLVITANYKVNSSSSAAGLDFSVGSGFTDGYTNSKPAASLVNTGFDIYNNSTAKIYDYAAATALSSTGITQSSSLALTWVINNSGSSITYTNPNSGTTTLATGKWDLWQGTTQFVTAASVTTSTVALQNLYIGNNVGKNNSITIDDITVYDLTPSPTGITPVVATTSAKIYTSNKSIVVEGNAGANVSVVNLDGVALYSGVVSSTKETLPVSLQTGVYAVRVNGVTTKVIVK